MQPKRKHSLELTFVFVIESLSTSRLCTTNLKRTCTSPAWTQHGSALHQRLRSSGLGTMAELPKHCAFVDYWNSRGRPSEPLRATSTTHSARWPSTTSRARVNGPSLSAQSTARGRYQERIGRLHACSVPSRHPTPAQTPCLQRHNSLPPLAPRRSPHRALSARVPLRRSHNKKIRGPRSSSMGGPSVANDVHGSRSHLPHYQNLQCASRDLKYSTTSFPSVTSTEGNLARCNPNFMAHR